MKFYRTHFLVLFLGSCAGIAAAYGISLLPLPYGSDIASARKLGIVSPTILGGYSKTRDIVNYLALITLPSGFAMLSWYIWTRGKGYDILCRIYELPEQARKVPDRLRLLAVFATILLSSFNINYFYRPISEWSFPMEEGVNLAAVSSILGGGVQSLDFTSFYGPMLIYPLALLMKLIGTTVLTDRIYTYLLNLVAYVIVTLFFYRTIRIRAIFVVASLVHISVFHPFVAVYPNSTYLRVALGFLPLLLIGQYFASKADRHLWICGLVAGQSLLFSQEVGICSFIALTAILFINNLQQRHPLYFIHEMLHLGGALLVSVAPMLIYFAARGALTSFLEELVVYPQLYSMGYGALQFPSLASLLNGQLSIQAFYPYWLIAIYLLATLWLLPQLIVCKNESRVLIPFSVLLMGLLLFRAALCRSDFYHIFFVAQPVFLLFFMILDQILCRIRNNGDQSTFSQAVVLIIFVTIFALPYFSPKYREVANDFIRQGFDVTTKFTSRNNEPDLMMNITGGVPIGGDLLESIAKIRKFLARNTVSGEYVYFYPNQAGYYFLFDRKNPTRYAYSYQAITAEQRLDIIKDLEAKKPRFVICSPHAWVTDSIPPNVQVPELHEYIPAKYALHEDMGDVLVMKRIDL